jgi:transposase
MAQLATIFLTMRSMEEKEHKKECTGKRQDCGVTAKDNRLFLEAVLWIARTGSPWRDLPKEFGNWHSVYVRFARWCKKGTWARLAEAVSDDPDLEMLFIDSTIVRAHQHAAGAPKKKGRKTSDVRVAD